MATLTQLIRTIVARSQIKTIPQLGFGFGFGSITEQRRASGPRKQRREIIAHLGRRQGIRWIKHVRAQQRANRAELAQLV